MREGEWPRLYETGSRFPQLTQISAISSSGFQPPFINPRLGETILKFPPAFGQCLSIISGYEIDSEKTYREQINSFADAFLHYVKIALAAIGVELGAAALATGLKDLLALWPGESNHSGHCRRRRSCSDCVCIVVGASGLAHRTFRYRRLRASPVRKR